MATAKNFITQITRIDGVADCILIRNDGRLRARPNKSFINHSALMIESCKLTSDIMKSSGFGHYRHLCFNRENNQHFYIFPIDKFLLGVVQQGDCHIPGMLGAIYHLIGRVSTGKSDINQDGS